MKSGDPGIKAGEEHWHVEPPFVDAAMDSILEKNARNMVANICQFMHYKKFTALVFTFLFFIKHHGRNKIAHQNRAPRATFRGIGSHR
ncbi:hypothetical protein RR42_s2553 [Cupriavidus basilensis]|uniref:Uncharacterized protein n=1 Tax=Cupriavidus basilensis TaxID=68895 RepID=A0A0C4YNR1_9BURK|nr:hypothetical protein RR42_s2553 [Cupriavidus basilensis]